MAADTDSGKLESCSAFIKQKTRHWRKWKSGTRMSQDSLTDDDYGFLRQSPSPVSTSRRRRKIDDTDYIDVSIRDGSYRSFNGSIASAGIPITLGSIAGSSDQRGRQSAFSRSNSPWSEMSINTLSEWPFKSPGHNEINNQNANRREWRSKSAGPALRDSNDMNFYSEVRPVLENWRSQLGREQQAESLRRRSRSEHRPREALSSSSCTTHERPFDIDIGRPSRRTSRQRDYNDVRTTRSSSKSREIIALYTSSSIPGSEVRSMSATRQLQTTLISQLPAKPISLYCDRGELPSLRDRTRRSKSAAPAVAARSAVVRSRHPATILLSENKRSKSLPRADTHNLENEFSFSDNGAHDCDTTEWFSKKEAVTHTLKQWMSSASGTETSHRASRRKRDQQRLPFTAVLEMDKDANAKIETLLNHCNSLKPANVPVMVIASYKPTDDSWAKKDEISVEAETVVLALYKQNEWIYVKSPDVREGFMPYAYTKPIKMPVPIYTEAGAMEGRVKTGKTSRGMRGAAPRTHLDFTVATIPVAQTVPAASTAVSPSCVRFSSLKQDSRLSENSSSVNSSHLLDPVCPNARNDKGASTPCKSYRVSPLVFDAKQYLERRPFDICSQVSTDESVFYDSYWPTNVLPNFCDNEPVLTDRSVRSLSKSVTPDYSNGAFYSDSGISEPCSEMLADEGNGFGPVWPKSRASKSRTSFGNHLSPTTRPSNGDESCHMALKRGSRKVGHRKARQRRQHQREAGSYGFTEVTPQKEFGSKQRALTQQFDRLSTDAHQRAKLNKMQASVELDIQRDYSGPSVTVVYDYDAENPDDVAVRAGETVRLLNGDDSEWIWIQKRDGSEGFIPTEFILFLDLKPRLCTELSTTIVAAV